MDPNSWEVEDNKCNPYKVTQPDNSGDVGNANICKFAPQATAPMPLEAIQDLFEKTIKKTSSVLKPDRAPPGTVWVTKDFFAKSPGGVSGDSLKDDTLGFFSLVMSYAKADKCPDDEDCANSVKDVTSIMPRNDFSSIYKLLKDNGGMPDITGSLWDLVLALSCFKNSGSDVV